MSCGSHRLPRRIPGTVTRVELFPPQVGMIWVRPQETMGPWGPGQFAMVFPSASNDPLLGRPLGLAGQVDGQLLFLCRGVGRGTRMLLSSPPGFLVHLVGPLGSPLAPLEESKLILLGGGVGLAALLPLADRADRLLWAVRDGTWAGLMDRCSEALGLDRDRLVPVFEDGPPGEGCNGVEALCRLPMDLKGSTVVACGPSGMLRAVWELGRERGFRSLLGLERRMACGFGGCMGCAIDLKGGVRARVCKDGPFFWGEDLDHEAFD
ncbi:hypothetical protein [Thermanaerovibrio acidaminovorans]|uniref:iron-sulfur cluster-binding protein n=1 Tax=Thermanaerovibrio acidaminovorans TaxID=81462 RepID=UPI00248FF323|nr:hypothetical protein [Thermanaerovibrio acidaminovorans]